MLNSIVEFSSGRKALIALALLVVGGGLLFQFGPYTTLKQLTGGLMMPEEQFAGVEGVARYLQALEQPGREIYGGFQWLDLINPLLSGFFMWMLFGWLIKKARWQNTKATWIMLLPIFLLLAELVENYTLGRAAADFPNLASLTEWAQPATNAKFAVFAIAIIGLAVGGSGFWGAARASPAVRS